MPGGPQVCLAMERPGQSSHHSSRMRENPHVAEDLRHHDVRARKAFWARDGAELHSPSAKGAQHCFISKELQ